jgi:hypothetical protein
MATTFLVVIEARIDGTGATPAPVSFHYQPLCVAPTRVGAITAMRRYMRETVIDGCTYFTPEVFALYAVDKFGAGAGATPEYFAPEKEPLDGIPELELTDATTWLQETGRLA